MEEILARAVQIFLALAGAYLVALWFALAVWTYRDIGSRSQSVVTQVFSTLMVVLFSIPGAMLYLLLRPRETLDQAFQRSLEEEYLLQDLEELPLCHSCHRYVEDDFVLCPHCQATLRDGCKSCGRLIQVKWSVCPYCGEDQTERAAAIREQIEPPARRWIGRGGRSFRPIAPGTVIREVYSDRETVVPEIAAFDQPSLADVNSAWAKTHSPVDEPAAADAATTADDTASQSDEPVRLFDRKRTRQRRKEQESHANVASATNTDGSSNGVGHEPMTTDSDSVLGMYHVNGHTSDADAEAPNHATTENGDGAASDVSDEADVDVSEPQPHSASKR